MPTSRVQVPGGALAYEVLPARTEPVLAVHGISSQRRLWTWLRDAWPELGLIAPDLRGRADSVGVGGPYGPQRHADDLAAVLDAEGLAAVHVVGMSMGGFVAVHLADRHPERVKSLVLVDGGFPMAVPSGLTSENVESAFADRVGRLARTWSDLDEYLDYFCATTAPLLDRDDPLLRYYAEHDLRDGRVRLSGDALVADAREIFFGPSPWERLGRPARFLHAEWSVGADTPPAYPADLVDRYSSVATTYPLTQVDHAASIMSRRGARATAEMLREALA